MENKEKALIELDYVAWVLNEAEKTGHNILNISDVVRKYENRMKRRSDEINKSLAKVKEK